MDESSRSGRLVMHVVDLTKPDGRSMTLYGCDPIDRLGPLQSPVVDGGERNPHLRWHPLLATWVAYAAYRQNRTFLPPPEYNPLRPSADPANPTELPTGNYQIAVFDNLFPTLMSRAHDPPSLEIPTMRGVGHCEVVVYSQNPDTSLGGMPLAQIELLIEVWGDRTRRLGGRAEIQYVLPFENRGVEVGVTLHHPHGQIYAYPFIPAVPARMQNSEREYYGVHQRPLLQSLLERESAAPLRMIYEGPEAVAWLPAWARYPYEVWVAPRSPTARLDELDTLQRRDLARALKTVLLKFDGLWSTPFPYVMAWYQAPTDGQPHPEAHLHAEFYPAYRARGKLKYLAGTEVAAGMFANDALPEDKARELQAVAVEIG